MLRGPQPGTLFIFVHTGGVLHRGEAYDTEAYCSQGPWICGELCGSSGLRMGASPESAKHHEEGTAMSTAQLDTLHLRYLWRSAGALRTPTFYVLGKDSINTIDVITIIKY